MIVRKNRTMYIGPRIAILNLPAGIQASTCVQVVCSTASYQRVRYFDYAKLISLISTGALHY